MTVDRFCCITRSWKIVKRNPFATIDQDGVGQLMQIAIEKGRKTRRKSS